MEETMKIRERSEIPVEDTWATEDLYATDEAWEAELATLDADKEKIVSFADAIHNVPTQMEWNFRLSVSFMEGQFSAFERRYGKTYLAHVWELHQPNRKRRWFRK